MRRIFGHGRYANVTATLALVIALGGTSYAAVTITGKNIRNGSIKRVDLGNNSVTSAKVKNGSLTSRDLKAGLLAGIRGPKGDKGDKGEPGAKGEPGTVTAGTLPSQLAAGQTLRGYVKLSSSADAGTDTAETSVSFPFPLAASAPALVTHFIESGVAPPPGCSGSAASPSADGGHLCLFETGGAADGTKTISASRFGFALGLGTSAGTFPAAFSTTAVWAVTAPA